MRSIAFALFICLQIAFTNNGGAVEGVLFKQINNNQTNFFLSSQSWRVQAVIWLSFEGSEDRSKIENSLLALMSGYADLPAPQKQVQHTSTDLPIF